MLHQQQVGQLFADTWLIPNLVVNFIKIEKKTLCLSQTESYQKSICSSVNLPIIHKNHYSS